MTNEFDTTLILTRPRVNHVERLYFLHIPKTAGTSVRMWLQQLFPDGQWLPIDHLPELERLSDDEICSYRFASGHFGWRYMERVADMGIDAAVVSFFRDPVEVFLSGWNFLDQVTDDIIERLGSVGDAHRAVRESGERGAIEEVVRLTEEPGFDIDEVLLGLPEEMTLFSNMSVRFVSQHGTQAETLEPLTLSDLESAKQRVATMPFFGLAHEVGWSEVLFADAFRLPLLNLERHNQAKRKVVEHLPESFVAFYRRVNAFDVELYDFACLVFAEKIQDLKQAYDLPDSAQPEDFENVLLTRFLNERHSLSPLRSADVSLGDGVLCPGFQSRFLWEDIGRWVRWSGPGRNLVCLPLDRRLALRLRIEIAAFLSDEAKDQLAVEEDGQRIPHQFDYVTDVEGRLRCFVAVTLPTSSRVKPYTALDLIGAAPVVADGLADSSSFAIADIEVRPL